MSLFLSNDERKFFDSIGSDPIFANSYWALFTRVTDRVNSTVYGDKETTTAFWHNVAEYLGDAAFLGAQRNDDSIKKYVKKIAIDIANMPQDSWIGPVFRQRTYPLRGHLETSHLSIALSLALDLCKDAFTEQEYAFCAQSLKENGIFLCKRWLDKTEHFVNNWNAVLAAGVAVPAAVLGLKDELEFCTKYLAQISELLQSDGSYGEGLQYGNYYLWAFLLANEAVVRAGYPSASLERAGKYLEYAHYNLLMNKPLSGWGVYPRPRCFNYDDCTAMFAPNPDLLALLGCRLKESMPEKAVLAREIYERFYSENPAQGPFDRTSFGFIPRAGWMNLLFYMQMKKDGSIEKFANTRAFNNGIAVIRTGCWSDSELAVAVKCPPPEGLTSAGHRHLDFNSLQLFFGKERLIADPGHTCYRAGTRETDVATGSHSTCTFRKDDGTVISQKKFPTRMSREDGSFGTPVTIPGKLEFTGSCDEVSVIVSETGDCYGNGVTLFRRFVIVCGKNAVFVIDEFDTDIPVKVSWNWCLNNRDGLLEYKVVNDASSTRTVARRGNAGLKMFCADREKISAGAGRYGFLHDAYHPDAGVGGAGNAGTAIHAGHSEKVSSSGRRRYIFPMAADIYGASAHWHLRSNDPLICALESFGTGQLWQVDASQRENLVITDKNSGRTWHLLCENGVWNLNALFPVRGDNQIADE